MKNVGCLIAALLFSTVAQADLLTLKPTSPAVVNTGVPISLGATASVAGKSYDLITVGSALRWKQVLGKSNIYVGELLVSDKDRYVKTVAGALSSLENEQSVALVLHFVYNVPTFLVTMDFNAAAKANGISTDDPDIAAFMKVIGTLSFRNGGQFTLFFNKNNDGAQTLAIEDKLGGTAPEAIAPLSLSAQGKHKILALWLGKAGDDGLVEFQTNLMK